MICVRYSYMFSIPDRYTAGQGCRRQEHMHMEDAYAAEKMDRVVLTCRPCTTKCSSQLREAVCPNPALHLRLSRRIIPNGQRKIGREPYFRPSYYTTKRASG